MEPLDTVGRALRLRPAAADKLRKAEEKAAAQPLSWYSFFERRMQQKEIQSLRSELAGYEWEIGDDGAHRLATAAADQFWRRAAKDLIPNKNPYGRAAKMNLDQILAHLWEWRDEQDFLVGANDLIYRVTDVPEVDELVTKEFIRSHAQNTIAEWTKIASDTEMLHQETFIDHREAMIVQHRASGLRAMFILHGNGIGEVNSDPASIESIDPEYPTDNQAWLDLLGLGIGSHIYAEGHRFFPDVRWITKAFSQYSEPLRNKLHAEDPYLWEGQCEWCNDSLVERGIKSWRKADKQFFIHHP